jgi:hypothetical protein
MRVLLADVRWRSPLRGLSIDHTLGLLNGPWVACVAALMHKNLFAPGRVAGWHLTSKAAREGTRYGWFDVSCHRP